MCLKVNLHMSRPRTPATKKHSYFVWPHRSELILHRFETVFRSHTLMWVKIALHRVRHPPKGSRPGSVGAQEDIGGLVHSSWHILVLSWLWQAPNPLASAIRPWQAWPLSDCSSHWQADWLTDCLSTFQTSHYLSLFTPALCHVQQHSM